jgi:hypothetical protein
VLLSRQRFPPPVESWRSKVTAVAVSRRHRSRTLTRGSIPVCRHAGELVSHCAMGALDNSTSEVLARWGLIRVACAISSYSSGKNHIRDETLMSQRRNSDCVSSLKSAASIVCRSPCMRFPQVRLGLLAARRTLPRPPPLDPTCIVCEQISASESDCLAMTPSWPYHGNTNAEGVDYE